MLAFEGRWAAVIMRTFSDTDDAPPWAVSSDDYLAALETLRSRARWLARVGLRLAIWLIALAPLWRLSQVATFASLPAERRRSLLEELLAHPSLAVREAAFVMKFVASLALFKCDEVRAYSGYDGPAEKLTRLSAPRRS